MEGLGNVKAKKKKNRKRFKISKRSKLIIVLCYEFVLGMVMLNILFDSVSLNTSEEIQYADQSGVDDIRCEEHTLIVNDVSVAVPPNENVSYNISYSWGEKDKKYPTIPRSITASYKNTKNVELYDISLYKESFTPKEKLKMGENEANWFNSWRTGKDGKSMRELKDTKNVHGFLIDTKDSDDEALVYENITYYFTVPSSDGVAVYVLESNLYNKKAQSQMQKAMNSAMNSIKTKAKENNAEDDNDQNTEEQAA